MKACNNITKNKEKLNSMLLQQGTKNKLLKEDNKIIGSTSHVPSLSGNEASLQQHTNKHSRIYQRTKKQGKTKLVLKMVVLPDMSSHLACTQ